MNVWDSYSESLNSIHVLQKDAAGAKPNPRVEKSENFSSTSAADSDLPLSLCLRAYIKEYFKRPFKEPHVYMTYFKICHSVNKRISKSVFLDKKFMPLKECAINSYLFDDIPALAKFLESAAASCVGAAYVIVSKNSRRSSFEYEMPNADKLFNEVKSVELYDYILINGDSIRPLISPFR